MCVCVYISHHFKHIIAYQTYHTISYTNPTPISPPLTHFLEPLVPGHAEELLLDALGHVIVVVVAADLLLGDPDQEPLLLFFNGLELLVDGEVDLLVQFLVSVLLVLNLLLDNFLPLDQVDPVFEFDDGHDFSFAEDSKVHHVLVQIIWHLAVDEVLIPFLLSERELVVLREDGVGVLAL